jgi:hypothetical protein
MTGARRAPRVAAIATAALAAMTAASTVSAATWGTIRTVRESGSQERHSMLAVGGGAVHALVRGGAAGVLYRRSPDGGDTWGGERTVFTASYGVYALALAASGRLVAAVMSQTTSDPDHKKLVFRRSADGGATWAPPQSLTVFTSAEKFVGYPAIAVSGANILVVWTDRRDGKVYARRSADSGATFAAARVMGTTSRQEYLFGEYIGYEALPAVAAAGPRFYVVFTPRGANALGQGLTLRRSTDGGATFLAGQPIAAGPVRGRVNAAASASTLLIQWPSEDGTIKLARSVNDGARHTVSTVRAPRTEAERHQTDHDLALSGTAARIVSADRDGNITVLSSANAGATWTSQLAVAAANGGEEVNVALPAGATLITWTGWTPDYLDQRVRSRRGT